MTKAAKANIAVKWLSDDMAEGLSITMESTTGYDDWKWPFPIHLLCDAY